MARTRSSSGAGPDAYREEVSASWIPAAATRPRTGGTVTATPGRPPSTHWPPCESRPGENCSWPSPSTTHKLWPPRSTVLLHRPPCPGGKAASASDTTRPKSSQQNQGMSTEVSGMIECQPWRTLWDDDDDERAGWPGAIGLFLPNNGNAYSALARLFGVRNSYDFQPLSEGRGQRATRLTPSYPTSPPTLTPMGRPGSFGPRTPRLTGAKRTSPAHCADAKPLAKAADGARSGT